MILNLLLGDFGNILEILIVLLVLGAMSINIVPQQRVFIIERLGKFSRVARPGLTILIPFVDRVAKKLDMRIESIDVTVETITKDKVPTKIMVAVQRYILNDHPEDAYYKQVNPDAQIESYIFDVVRNRVPQLDLDAVFENKDEIASALKKQLTEKKEGEDRVIMSELGFGIATTLVTNIDPDEAVKKAMAEINENKRKAAAAEEKAKAYKVLRNARADADKYQKRASGEGYADKRNAITTGITESDDKLKAAYPTLNDAERTNIILITEYFDMKKDMARGAGRVIFEDGGIKGFADAKNGVMAALFAGEVEADKVIEKIQKEREEQDPGAQEIQKIEGEMRAEEESLMEGAETVQ